MFHTGCKWWAVGQFKGQADFYELGWFIVWNRPLLLWLIVSSTVAIPSLDDNEYSSCGIHINPIVYLSSKSASVLALVLGWSITVRIERQVEGITSQLSKLLFLLSIIFIFILNLFLSWFYIHKHVDIIALNIYFWLLQKNLSQFLESIKNPKTLIWICKVYFLLFILDKVRMNTSTSML